MPYATAADIVDLYGAQQLAVIADRDGDGLVDAGTVERALAEASTEIDLHIGARYPLPLPTIPDALRRLTIDIAVYRLALAGSVATTEFRTRYDDAIKLCQRIAEGKATLQLPPEPGTPAEDGAASSGPRPIVTSGPDRLFSRTTTRGL